MFVFVPVRVHSLQRGRERGGREGGREGEEGERGFQRNSLLGQSEEGPLQFDLDKLHIAAAGSLGFPADDR